MMEACFRQPLVEARRGGNARGREVQRKRKRRFEALPRDGRGMYQGEEEPMEPFVFFRRCLRH